VRLDGGVLEPPAALASPAALPGVRVIDAAVVGGSKSAANERHPDDASRARDNDPQSQPPPDPSVAGPDRGSPP
jgi:hypothetical protein